MDRNEVPLDPHHIGVPSGVSKVILEPMVRSAQTVHLSCVEINTVSNMDRNEFPFDPCHIGSTIGCVPNDF
jgi:hypothetical protein